MPALAIAPRLAFLAVTGATALSVAALSSPAPAYAQSDHVIGLIASVSGNTLQVTQSTGNAAVQYASSTQIREALPAHLSDVALGSCIKAGPTSQSAPASSGAITAQWVRISSAVDGKCPQPQESSSTTPSAAPAPHRAVQGVVDSVTGNTITLTPESATGSTSKVTVTVTDTTSYKKRVAANTGAITQGKCVAARGTKDSSGVLQATKVTVWAATDGKCPQSAD